MKRLAVECLIVALLVLAVARCSAKEQSANAALVALRARAHTTDSLRVVNAQLWAENTKPRIDTARLYANRYKAVRDGVTVITDTVLVKEALAVADTLVKECVSLATACEEYKATTDRLVESLTGESQGWRRMYENAVHPRCGRKCGIALGVGATVLSAVLLNQVQKSLRPTP